MPHRLRPLTYRARTLRRAETPAERELWRWLRGRKVEGAKFRRQQPLGPFVVDFFCGEARLVIEADGAGHFPTPLGDHTRDLWLTAAGLTILRFENCQILNRTAAVVEHIRQAIQGSRRRPDSRHPSPSGRGAGGEGLSSSTLVTATTLVTPPPPDSDSRH